MRQGFIFQVSTDGLEVDKLQLQAYGRGDSLPERLGDALARWARNQPELAARFTLDTRVDASAPEPG